MLFSCNQLISWFTNIGFSEKEQPNPLPRPTIFHLSFFSMHNIISLWLCKCIKLTWEENLMMILKVKISWWLQFLKQWLCGKRWKLTRPFASTIQIWTTTIRPFSSLSALLEMFDLLSVVEFISEGITDFFCCLKRTLILKDGTWLHVGEEEPCIH